MRQSVAVALDSDDIKLALVAYAMPVARLLGNGARLVLADVTLDGLDAGDLSAVVEWERADDDTEGESDGPAVV
jgi:hypothetical protein